MKNNGYVLLDTSSIQNVLDKKDSLVKSYGEINQQFDTTVGNLLQNWHGKGALAFQDDCKTVQKNITGIYDILKTMCDTLSDCLDVFSECDSSLNEHNISASKEDGEKK